MKKILLTHSILIAFFSCSSSFAALNYKDDQFVKLNPWFVVVGSGYAWSNNAGVSHPDLSLLWGILTYPLQSLPL